MPVPKKVTNFLDKKNARYKIIEHKTVYTAFDKTQTLKLKPYAVGKTLVLKNGHDFAIASLPANKNLDKRKFKRLFNEQRKKKGKKPVKKIRLASEKWMKKKLRGVKLGAVPPFGSLFKCPTFVHKSLLGHSKMIMNSGHYDYSISISPSAFKKAVPDLSTGSFTKARK